MESRVVEDIVEQMTTDPETPRCLCPKCQRCVDESATQCESCGEYFPAMDDRKTMTTMPNMDRFARVFYPLGMAILSVLFFVFLIALAFLVLNQVTGSPTDGR